MTSTATTPKAVTAKPRADIGVKTLRGDRWWLPPLVTVTVLTIFIVYTTVRIFMRDYYYSAEHHYLTPLYSPCLSQACVPGSSHFGQPLPDLPRWIPLPILVFPILAGFRLTCYYYRKAYYRSFWASPPSCAVPDGHARYTGETRFPLIIQNLHRYVFYAAFVILLINLYDMVLAFDGEAGIGFGVGNLIMVINWAMLAAYTVGCHSCRHATGGRLRHFSKHPLRYWAWTQVSKLNGRHMQFAWISLTTVMVLDAYIMAVSAGWITDLRFFN
jgi:hypothetical protein